ncbi:hypothetical protein [Candidatus Phytoplasma pruni]|uniref:Uncharacterized protein n=1 Tax=Candidatus Phytoplasma pruni TaxID=479893 RepID=A0A851H9F3_9MOLU|nr:hypothetical protein [Candidatus Phytoplasma pruni]NWN45562.1 hypothetical protein [Candidatus Phytoplasma pruni]
MKTQPKFRYSFVKKHDPFKYFKRFKIKKFFDDVLYPLDKAIQHSSFIDVEKSNLRFHEVPNIKLIQAGFQKIIEFAEGNAIHQLKTTEQSRLLGIKINYVFYILGFDPNHDIY